MTEFGAAIRAVSEHALGMVRDGQVVGLGSGRAAAALVKALAARAGEGGISITGVPTSLQIKLAAEEVGIPLIEADQIGAGGIDIAFDGADQIDAARTVIKGGGGALLRENIVASSSKKFVVMADATKFVQVLDRDVPVEVHPLARAYAADAVRRLGGEPRLRLLDRGYPLVTENGGVILDCRFGPVRKPVQLRRRLAGVAGVLEVGIFDRRPDVIYKAMGGGRFDVIQPERGRRGGNARAGEPRGRV